LNLSAWDTAAGVLIVEEAGGKVTDFSNQKFSNYTPEIVASNSLIHDRMIEVIAMAGKK
jgi:myo-inositol-1(or 4)-monophosphatase